MNKIFSSMFLLLILIFLYKFKDVNIYNPPDRNDPTAAKQKLDEKDFKKLVSFYYMGTIHKKTLYEVTTNTKHKKTNSGN